jgi:hypothetical protein
MARGDHLRVRRWTGYWHHGIDLGDGRVMHYSNAVGAWATGEVRVSSWQRFSRGAPIELVRYADCHPPELVIARARGRLGERRYHLLRNNCEHFARWFKSGQAASTSALSVATVGGVVGVLLGAGAMLAHRLATPAS